MSFRFSWIGKTTTVLSEKGLTGVYSDDSMTTSPNSKSSWLRPESEWGPTRKLRKDKMQLKLEAVESALLGMIGSVAVSVCEKMMERKVTKKRELVMRNVSLLKVPWSRKFLCRWLNGCGVSMASHVVLFVAKL